jgi:hypothetical protein
METVELDTKTADLKLSVFDSLSEKSQDNKGETVSCREKQRINIRNFQRGTGQLEIQKIE